MHDIHQAIAHGIANDLQPPPGTKVRVKHLQGIPDTAGSWAVQYHTASQSQVEILVGTVYLEPEALEYHDRQRVHRLDYEDPALFEQLQLLLDQTDTRYIVPLYDDSRFTPED